MPPLDSSRRLLEVVDKSQHAQRDALTALCMGQHGAAQVLLVAGHASGAVRVWELKTQLGGGVHFALTKSLAGMHAAPITAAALLDGWARQGGEMGPGDRWGGGGGVARVWPASCLPAPPSERCPRCAGAWRAAARRGRSPPTRTAG